MSTTSGWGRFTWGQAYWNADATLKTGWGAQAWNDGEWGELNDVILTLTAPSAMTAGVGSVTISAEINTGWGQDTWGNETWGESGMLVELTAPDAMQSNVSANAWNDASWGQGQGWGIFSLAVAVSAKIGVDGLIFLISAIRLYAGLKSCPHSEMQ